MSLFFSQFQFLNTPDAFNPLDWADSGLHEMSMYTNRKPVLWRALRSTNRSGMPARSSNLFAEGSRAALSTRQHFELENENDPPISVTKILCLSFSPSHRVRLRNALRPRRRLYRPPSRRCPFLASSAATASARRSTFHSPHCRKGWLSREDEGEREGVGKGSCDEVRCAGDEAGAAGGRGRVGRAIPFDGRRTIVSPL